MGRPMAARQRDELAQKHPSVPVPRRRWTVRSCQLTRSSNPRRWDGTIPWFRAFSIHAGAHWEKREHAGQRHKRHRPRIRIKTECSQPRPARGGQHIKNDEGKEATERGACACWKRAARPRAYYCTVEERLLWVARWRRACATKSTQEPQTGQWVDRGKGTDPKGEGVGPRGRGRRRGGRNRLGLAGGRRGGGDAPAPWAAKGRLDGTVSTRQQGPAPQKGRGQAPGGAAGAAADATAWGWPAAGGAVGTPPHRGQQKDG